MALAPLLYNITFDSQTRILYFWDKAGHEIYHCEVPSPAQALPTVSSESWVNFTARMEDRYKDIAANEQIDVHVGSLFDTVPYDSSLVYAISKIYYNTVTVGHGELQCIDNSGVLAVKNVTSSTIRADGGYYQTCDSTDATIITVYDSSNNPYNAFKYTSDGTDCYYVLDGTQTDWTDDLSSIGYHTLFEAYFTTAGASGTDDTYIPIFTSKKLYDANGNVIPMDTTKTYTLVRVRMFDGTYPSIVSSFDFPGNLTLDYLNAFTRGTVSCFCLEYTAL